VAALQAEVDAMTPEEKEAERTEWLGAILSKYGQAGVDKAIAEEERDRRKEGTHGGI